MKKVALLLALATLITVGVFAQEAVDIDSALSNSLGYFNGRLPAGTKIVILNISTNNASLAEYIIDELTHLFVNDGRLTVIDRQNLEIIRRELNFQYSGDVSDESMQSIGRMIGAQTIISGAIAQMGNVYRLRLRAIAVETAAIQGIQTTDVLLDRRLANLTGEQAQSQPKQSKGRWKAKEGHDHWISGEAGFFGGGVRYEYRIFPIFSVSAFGLYSIGLLLGGDVMGGGISARLYPAAKTFFFEMGYGYYYYSSPVVTGGGGYTYEYGVGGYTEKEIPQYKYYWHGSSFGITPGFGWTIDFGKPGGFFLSPSVRFPITIGSFEPHFISKTEVPVSKSDAGSSFGYGLVVFLGLGGTF